MLHTLPKVSDTRCSSSLHCSFSTQQPALIASCSTRCSTSYFSQGLKLQPGSSLQRHQYHRLMATCHGSTVDAPQSKAVTEKKEYRRNVGICVVNKDGLVFAARRVDDSHRSWQMPQGGIDPYENPMTAALRELKEETGMRNVVLLGSLDEWLKYDFPTDVRCQLQGTWLRYRGQTQKWYLAHFYGDESEIDLAHEGKPEFSEYCWKPLEHLPQEVVPFKKEVYQQVATAFVPKIERWLEEQKQKQEQAN